MTQAAECSDPDGYRPSSYSVSAQQGRPKQHAGLSCGDLHELTEQSAAMPPATSGLRQPAPGAGKPDRSEACASPFGAFAGAVVGGSERSSPRHRGTTSSSSCSLDQYNSMLPDNPVQQLPLLPATAASATSVRVAAWLLGGPAHHNDAVGCAAASDAAASLDGGASDTEALLADLERSASGSMPPSAGASLSSDRELGGGRSLHAAAAAALPDAEGYLPTAYYCKASRRSLDGFLRSPVQHGDALNNYVAALY